ncbi:MAG: twin-arginine translocase subunit TatC [Myxococcales bacterium]|nr:twin-arginine translocase subunit TatC [Myxococcales bacterium]USN50429.1 MAG: twin-arginine translocase subunit TatC [Myxococcales bacterium]
MDEREQPLLTHLAELRGSLIKALIGVFIAMIVAYFFVDSIMYWLKKPMMDIMPEGSKFVVLSPQEYFFTELKAALFCGLILSVPWIFLQIWNFVSPGLYRHERRMLILFVISASLCFVLGVLFAYFLVFPPTFNFFLESLPLEVSGAYSISMLYGFAMTLLLAFGIVFQMPIAVYLLISFDLVSLETFASYRRLVIVAAFIVGALLTPPDPITQVMLALPTYLLFELGLFLARISIKNRSS